MRYFFILKIDTSPDKVSKVNEILGVSNNNDRHLWGHELITPGNEYANFIDYFLNILEGKYIQLEELKVMRQDITFWMIYEYDEQCNMDFLPKDLKRLGDNGISFCVSCYGKE